MQTNATDLHGLALRTYLGALVAVARVDGVSESERAFVEHQASLVGVETEELWAAPAEELSTAASAPEKTRRLIIRDCLVLAAADGQYTSAERERIRRLAAEIEIDETIVVALEDWLERYVGILEEGTALLNPSK